MTLTPEQKAEGWIEWHGGECPIKDDWTAIDIMLRNGRVFDREQRGTWVWRHDGKEDDIIAYRIIEAHGADAEPARPTPFPADYSELVWDADGWSQTIIVDGKRPEWLRDDDECTGVHRRKAKGWRGRQWTDDEIAIRVRRREPKRETVTGWLCHVPAHVGATRVSYDLIDGKPDLSTLKIAEDAL